MPSGMGTQEEGSELSAPQHQCREQRYQTLCQALWEVLAKGEAAHRPGGGRRRGAGQGHHLLDGQPELEPVQGIADPDLPLDLRVRQG